MVDPDDNKIVKDVEEAMEKVKEQPLAAGIAAGGDAWRYYATGVVTDKDGCRDDRNHAIVIVGYGFTDEVEICSDSECEDAHSSSSEDEDESESESESESSESESESSESESESSESESESDSSESESSESESSESESESESSESESEDDDEPLEVCEQKKWFHSCETLNKTRKTTTSKKSRRL